MAFVVVWEFRVRPVCVNEFVKLYNGEMTTAATNGGFTLTAGLPLTGYQ